MRYRAAKAVDESAAATLRDSIPTKLASAVWNCISKYKSTVPNFPQTETCELLILDRSIDQVIHQFPYTHTGNAKCRPYYKNCFLLLTCVTSISEKIIYINFIITSSDTIYMRCRGNMSKECETDRLYI